MNTLTKDEAELLASAMKMVYEIMSPYVPFFVEGKVGKAASDIRQQASYFDSASVIYSDYSPNKTEAIRKQAEALEGMNQFILASIEAYELKARPARPTMGF
jgi:hypothetical protein